MYRPSLSSEERDSTLYSIMKAGLSEIEPITARAIRNRKRSYPRHIQALKPSRTELKPFLVADTETILIDNEHKPYAVGLLLVRPGKEIKNQLIDTYFSEDHSLILDSFEERSTKEEAKGVGFSTCFRRKRKELGSLPASRGSKRS
ncbi:DNA polymerase [Dendrobium catenatum]|uniref:DNA polymerase n=1 Tax=Dendrobium catenatum TaxID=906689 RepID=A0A2I0VSW0_9ASPA|nr:DNA polymerase [Dendrobium catenatum]